MFAEHGQHSFIEYLWTALKYLFVFSDAFRWTNATASTKSFFLRHIPVPGYWGQTLLICEDPTQGLDFVEPETWHNKEKCTEKVGL